MRLLSSRFGLLTRHFFRRFLDNDLISPNGDAHVGLSQTVAAIVTPGLLVVVLVMFKYGMRWRIDWTRLLELSRSDSLFFISLSMIVLGLSATITWDAFFLDARDRYILAVLPVSDRLLSGAKLAALGLFLAVFVVAANAIPCLLVPGLMLVPMGSAGLEHAGALMLAHAAAVCLGGAWSVLAVVALRGVLALLLPAQIFQHASALVQGILILAFLGWTISLSPFLDAAPGALAGGGPARDFSPPMWFLGLYQAAIGNPDPAYAPLARTALDACGFTALLVLIVFFAPRFRRGDHLAPASASGGLGIFSIAGRRLLARLAVRDPRSRASFAFTMSTMGRSAKHRLYLFGAIGAGLAWAVSGLLIDAVRSGRAAFGTVTPTTPALQVQFILVLFLVVAFRYGVLVPAALPANWLFRVIERRPVGPYFTGARRAALAAGLVPVVALVPLSAGLWGSQAAAYHAVMGVLYAAFIVQLLFGGLSSVPCAAAYVSGCLKLKSRGVYYVFGAIALAGAPAGLESLTFRGRLAPLTLPLWLAGITLILAIRRRRHERALPGLVFDDSNGEAVQTLGLSA